ncbi:glycerol kinase GlpK [Eubacteriaceae bacterium ES3]|nr:glycerol kinase GlpK [Eubacteriaceae bacterium ES3]
MKYILGIDEGTTGVNVMIFDHEVNIIGQAYSEFTQHFPQPGWVEHDAEEIWEVTMKMVSQALENGDVKPDQIEAIGITNQRETTVFWDKNTGMPVCRAIVWQDRRTLPICEALEAKDGAGIVDRTGMVILPNDAATKIRWLLDNDDAVKKGVDKGDLLYGTIDTWLVWKLTGGAAHVTDYSNTSVTLLLNARTLEYDEWILNELQIPRDILPELRSSSEIYGMTDADVFFGAKVPVAGILGDQQSATFGQGCLEKGMAKNTYGTGSFMLMNTGDQYIPPSDGVFSPVLWNAKGRTDYGLEGMADVSGAVLQWLRDGLGIISDASEAEVLAMQVDGSLGVYFVPAFVGLGAPYFDSYARGTIVGISRGTTKQHIARAALESMAYQVKDAFNVMEKKSGVKMSKLRADGGGAKSDFLLQFQADILGVPVERPVITETTTLGAVYAAGLAVGYWDSFEEIGQFWKIEKRFEPQISEEKRQELCGFWDKAVKRSAGWLK